MSMAPVALLDEGSFALNSLGKQSPSTEWATEFQNKILLFSVFLMICYSYLLYVVNKACREPQLRYQAEQRLGTEQEEAPVKSKSSTGNGRSLAVQINQLKGNHPLYGSLTVTELPKPREQSRTINLAAGTSVNGHAGGDLQPSRVLVTSKSVKTKPARQASTRSSRVSELMIPYGTFEGSFRQIASAKVKKVTFEERSISSWSTVVSEDFEA